MKKQIAMLLVAASFATLLAGCGSSGTTSSEGAAGSTGSASASAETAGNAYKNAAKPKSITWWTHDGMHKEDGTDLWVKEFEKKTGIGLDLQQIDNNEYYTKLEVAYASDTVPDIFDLDGEHLGIYASQGAIADLTDLVKVSGLYDKVDHALWDSVILKGRIYGVPREKPGACVTYVRKDWLDRLGMDIPTTYDEFIEMLTRFKNEIPECTVPYTAPAKANVGIAQNMPEFFQGATLNYTKVDGVWVDGMAQDNMVEALQRMQDAYAAGLIDTEVVTNTTSACRDKWYSGGVGVFTYWDGTWCEALTSRVKQNVPKAEVVAIPPIKGATYLYSAPSVHVISSKLSKEEIASIFKYFIEYAHDGAEGQVLFQSGVEGVHWVQDGDKLVPQPSLSNPKEKLLKVWITPWASVTPLTVTDKKMDLAPTITESLAVSAAYAQPTYVFPVSETRTKINSDLTTTRLNILAQVMMGKMSPEEGVAKYKAQAEALGVSTALKEMNANS